MASIKPLLDADGKPRTGPDGKPLYRARPRAGAGVQRVVTGNLHQVRDFVAKVEYEKRVGTYLDERRGRITVREWAEQWMAAQDHRPTSAIRVRKIFVGHLYPLLGDHLLVNVLHTDMKRWLTSRSKVLAPTTLRTSWGYVSALFRAAVSDRRISFSPCDGIRLKSTPRTPIVLPTLDEVEAITAELPARWRALAVVGAQTGLRPGELLGLCVEQVDFFGRQITVDRQLRLDVIVPEPKTAASCRVRPCRPDDP